MVRAAPKRSAIAPATGWLSPHIRFCTARAKANTPRPQPRSLLIGSRNSPKPWRRPMASVTTRLPRISTRIARRPSVLIASLLQVGYWPFAAQAAAFQAQGGGTRRRAVRSRNGCQAYEDALGGRGVGEADAPHPRDLRKGRYSTLARLFPLGKWRPLRRGERGRAARAGAPGWPPAR